MSAEVSAPVAVEPAGALASDGSQALAGWISQLTAPPLLAIAAALSVARALGPDLASGWLLAYIGLVVALPVAYLLWLLARGQVAGFHLDRREERLRPMAVTAAAAGLGWLVLGRGGAPPLLVTLAAATAIETLVLLAVTWRWKISAHACAIAALAMLLLFLAAPAAGLAVGAVPLVAWARVTLRRHTPAQVLAGAAVGAGGVALAFLVRAGSWGP
jgi:membrane-associated phospholipid phosphatase